MFSSATDIDVSSFAGRAGVCNLAQLSWLLGITGGGAVSVSEPPLGREADVLL